MPDPSTQPPPRQHDGLYVIGWRESIALPDWGIKHLNAKTDTGAQTSAIDAYDIEELDDGRVRFVVVASRRHPEKRRQVTASITRRTTVKSSTGHRHDRLFVSTRLKIGPVEKTIEISLISRHHMKCRMLIGRAALVGDFIVDPEHEFMLTNRPKRRPRPTPDPQ